MTDHADLPPNRRLPQAVRDTARLRIEAGLQHDSRRNRLLAPIGIAAAVLLIAGSGLALRAHRPPAPPVVHVPAVPVPTARPSAGTTWAMTEQERYKITEAVPPELTDRCERAQRATLPNGWRPVLKVSHRGVDVVVYQAGSTRIFCELTAASVALSAPTPAAPKGSGRAGFVSRFGTVAGVVDPRVENLSIRYTGDRANGEPYGDSAIVRDGIFIRPNGIAAAPTSLVLSMNGSRGFAPFSVRVAAADLPAPVTPVIDQPQPPVDRGSAAGVRLTDCFNRAYGPPVIDPESWTAGADAVLDADESVQVGHYRGMLAICLHDGATLRLSVDDGSFNRGPTEVAANSMFSTSSTFYDFHGSSNTVLVAGLIKDPRIASVSLIRSGGSTVTAKVVGGTFILPGIDLRIGRGQPKMIAAYDENDTLLGEAALPT